MFLYRALLFLPCLLLSLTEQRINEFICGSALLWQLYTSVAVPILSRFHITRHRQHRKAPAGRCWCLKDLPSTGQYHREEQLHRHQESSLQGAMAWSSMVHSLPNSPIKTGFLIHLPILDFAPCQRLQGCLHLQESKLRNMMGVLSLAAKHSMDFEAKMEEETLLVNSRAEGKSITGSIVALGKFDALHVGHRALAVQASKMGPPVLLSFKGMAEVLHWEKRLPIVAPCDRKRIMSLWADVCGGTAPLEYQLEFAKVRSLSPHDFVERLAKEFLVKGVVAGANYRFGYKAAGDASDLVQLCGKFGLEVFIVDPVMDDNTTRFDNVAEGLEDSNSREKGQVSSTRVRKALAVGDMKRVTQLLGRNHRLVLSIDDCADVRQTICAPLSSALNQVPIHGMYSSRVCLVPDGASMSHAVVDGHVRIGDNQVLVTLKEGSFQTDLSGHGFLCIDLHDRLPA